MTVICFDGVTLACDSQISTGNAAWSRVKKIRRVKHWVIGAAGALDSMSAFLKNFDPSFIEAGEDNPKLGPGVEALLISPTGVVHYMESSGIVTKIKTDGFIAIGSGSACAMSALAAGADAVQAVKIAGRYAEGCGGRTYSLKLNP